MTLSQKYQMSMKSGSLVALKMSYQPDSWDCGIIKHVGRSIVVVTLDHEFRYYGIKVYRKKFIGSIRCSKFEEIANKIIRDNKSIKEHRIPRWLYKCDSMQDVLKALKAKSIWPGVELAPEEEGGSPDFSIGQLGEIGTSDFEIRPYNSWGDWEGEYSPLLAEVAQVVFDDPYTSSFSEYLRNRD